MRAKLKRVYSTYRLPIWVIFAICITFPFLFIELKEGNHKAGYVAGLIVMMSVFWITEIVSLYVTALLPLLLLPLFQVSAASAVAASYFNDSIFLCFGTFVVGLAFHRWQIDKRAALKTALVFGGNPKRLLFGIMSMSAILSMWLNNTGAKRISFKIFL